MAFFRKMYYLAIDSTAIWLIVFRYFGKKTIFDNLYFVEFSVQSCFVQAYLKHIHFSYSRTPTYYLLTRWYSKISRGRMTNCLQIYRNSNNGFYENIHPYESSLSEFWISAIVKSSIIAFQMWKMKHKISVATTYIIFMYKTSIFMYKTSTSSSLNILIASKV